MTDTIEDLLTELETLGEALVAALAPTGDEEEVAYMTPIEPASEQQLQAAETAAGMTFPDDYRAFLKRGFKAFEATFEDEDADDGHDFATGGIDFVSPDIIVRDIADFRGMSDLYDESDREVWLLENGVPISFQEPHFVVSERGVHMMLYDGEADVSPIASSFTEFMRHWGAAGFFKTHSFKLYWGAMSPHLAPTIPVEDNKWLTYHRALYAY